MYSYDSDCGPGYNKQIGLHISKSSKYSNKCIGISQTCIKGGRLPPLLSPRSTTHFFKQTSTISKIKILSSGQIKRTGRSLDLYYVLLITKWGITQSLQFQFQIQLDQQVRMDIALIRNPEKSGFRIRKSKNPDFLKVVELVTSFRYVPITPK